ncbi:hypothetical protein [Intestinibacter bartlettii]|nr:hypothetical protein [Intestinibacter bartlettii]
MCRMLCLSPRNEDYPKCDAKLHSAIKKIKDDVTVIYKDRSVEY